MSGIEELLVRDINAVTETLTLSEDDLIEARRGVDSRAQSQQRRIRSMAVLGAAAAVVAVGALGVTAMQAVVEPGGSSAPAGTGPTTDDVYADFLAGEAPTPENLNGFWRVDNGTVMVRFQPDGTVQFSDQGAVISDPVTIGTYTIEGDTIAVTAADSPNCVGPEFTMRAALPEPGLVNVVLTEPRFGTCGTLATTISLEHVLPANGNFADFTSRGVHGWRPVADEKVVLGDWMAEGGRYLLEISENGTYYVADDSADVVDNGLWRIRESRLELFSRTESPRCEEGDFLILGNLEWSRAVTPFLRGTVEQNDCGGGWTPASWIQIPDAGLS